MKSPHESKHLETNGYRTHYNEAGQGATVILIHGAGPGAEGHGTGYVPPHCGHRAMLEFPALFTSHAMQFIEGQ